MGEPVPVPVKPPGVEVTVYPVIGVPPLFVGSVKAIDAEEPISADANNEVGG